MDGKVTRRSAHLLAAAVAALVMLAATATAQAYVIGGAPWPGHTITYYPSAYRKAVVAAAATWNAAHVGVTLQRVSQKSQADFIAVYDPSVNPCEGASLLGWQDGDQSRMWLGRGCNRTFMIITATHEMGHILGLDHETHRCARMNPVVYYPSGTPEDCNFHGRSYWLKHLLKQDDINGARALYGASTARAASAPRIGVVRR